MMWIIPVLVGAIVTFIFGALWYTVFFGKTWQKLMEFSQDDKENAKKNSMAKSMVMTFVLNLLTASVFYHLFWYILPFNVFDFICQILIIWVGFVLPVQFGTMLWEGKSFKLIVLNAANGILSASILAVTTYYLV